MTKEEIKFQCLRVAQDVQYQMVGKEDQPKWKDVEQMIASAQKIFEWVEKE